VLGDLREMSVYFFADPKMDLSMIFENKFLGKFSQAEIAGFLETAREMLAEISIEEWNAVKLQEVLNEILAKTELKPGEIFSLIRIAVSFASFSPALNLTLEVLGRETTLARIGSVIQAIKLEDH
jgi:glutamyl-tRNA synthetase